MYALAGCPSKPEQRNRGEESTNDCDGHTLLGFQLAIGVILGLLHIIQVGEERWHDEERANEKAEEGQAKELLPPTIDTDEDDWEEFKPDVEKGVDEADVSIESEHDRLLEVKREGSYEDLDSKIAG